MVNFNVKIVCCIVARTNSTRLPRKVLKNVSGKKMIEHIIDRMKGVSNLDLVYIATSRHINDDVLREIALRNDVKFYAGSEMSVINRLVDIANIEAADYVVRVTGDNIYTDSKLLKILIDKATEHGVDYARVEGAPIGVTAEVIRVTALKHCLRGIDPDLSEYLMLYMFDPDNYKTLVVDVSSWVPSMTTLTVDTPQDWERTEFIEAHCGGEGEIFLNDIVKLNKKSKIPYFYFSNDVRIKLPMGEYISVERFNEMMRMRVKKSYLMYSLSEEEYLNV